MYYCPNCKKKYSHYRHKCPECGTPCVPWDNRGTVLIVWIVVLSILLLALLAFAFIGPEKFFPADGTFASVTTSSQTSPTGTGSTSSTAPTTQPSIPPTTAPTSSTTTPTTGSNTGIGMYTKAELEAMDKTYPTGGFGAGLSSYPQRPAVPVAEQKKYEKYSAHFIGENINTVYLTFDCGYEHYENGIPVTSMILDTLKEKNVKAVFFVTMDYVKKQPNLVRRMIDEGHAVGNHSTTHPVMPSLSIEKMEREIMKLHEYVLEHFDYKMTLFRPPTGAYSIQSLAVVQNLGYKTLLWSFQYYDYDPKNQWSESKAFNRITGSAHNGAIFLLHAVSVTNAKVLDDVIDHLRNEKNYTIELFS